MLRNASPRPLIRTIAPSDADAVSTLITALGYPANEPDLRRRIRELSRSHSGGAYVAVVEDEIIGVIAFEICRMLHLERPVARITTLVVRPDQRSQGIGKALIDVIAATATAAECCAIEVTSNKKRRRALAFYKRNGFSNSSNRLFKALTSPPSG